MRHFGGFGLVLFAVTGLFAQGNGIAHSPVVTSGFGGLAHPGAGAPIRPYKNPAGYSNPRGAAVTPVYAYPVYVGGYGYGYGYSGSGYGQDSYGQDYSSSPAQAASAPAAQDQPAQPSMTIVYPPQQTIIINQYPSPDGGPPVTTVQQGSGMYGPQPATRRAPAPEPVADDSDQPSDAPHYLIAFKDHTIYSAMAYWVDGDTLHYFTTGNTHNQASLSLVDRDLTERLNREAGVDLKLPPAAAAAAK